MREFLAACVIAVVLAVGALFVLELDAKDVDVGLYHAGKRPHLTG